MSENNNGQLALFGGMISEEISRVFGGREVKNAKGINVGMTVGMRKRKEIAESLGLTHKNQKDELDAAVLTQRDNLWLQLKARIAALGPDWTFAKMTERKLGNGTEQISFVTQRIPRAKPQASDAEVLKLLKELDPSMTIEDVIQLRKDVAAKEKGQDVETVPSVAPTA